MSSPHREVSCAECLVMTIDQYQVDENILCGSCFEIYADSVSQKKVRKKAIVEKPVKEPIEIEVTVVEPPTPLQQSLEYLRSVEQVAEEQPQEKVEKPRPKPKRKTAKKPAKKKFIPKKRKTPPGDSIYCLKNQIKRRAARNSILHDAIERIQILFAIPKTASLDETISALIAHKQRFNEMKDDVAIERQRRLS